MDILILSDHRGHRDDYALNGTAGALALNPLESYGVKSVILRSLRQASGT